MTLDAIRDHCLALPGVTEDMPFGPEVLVFRVGAPASHKAGTSTGRGKMFALVDLPDAVSVNLKCDPERAIDLRERHAAITPGFHMNKTHWNTVLLDGSLSPALLRELIDHSYALVKASLPKKDRERLGVGG
ncbi:MAG: MmcQ/YjbR family DNA-binding protein [Flavobacteriales bacterium]|nr:MmcQ/YjbR family DNA-binding protein [Flavobacteriales bacterium]